MRIQTALASALTLGALSAAAGQVVVTPRASTVRGSLMPGMEMRIGSPRAVIGVSMSPGTGPRDTLGLLVSTITRNSPAEKAGIEEGNRIASINGVNLKLAAADIGDPDMEYLMNRRLNRELDKMKPGDEVELRVYGGGQLRTIKVKTVDPEDLYSSRTVSRRPFEDRPSLGIGIGSSGSKRDTLGVFIMAVEDAGPAAKAGIEEGQRIASINGVDLRVTREDAGDDIVSSARVNRFERELGKVKPGDAVDLRVYSNGQTRTVKVTTVAASELRGRGHSIIIRRPYPQNDLDIDGEAIGATVRRAIEKAQSVTGERLEDLGHMLDEIGRGMNGVGGGTVRWFNDDAPVAGGQIALPKPGAAPARRANTTIWM